MSDKERLIAFKNRIKQLELALEEKSGLVEQYEAIGNAADQKIAALNQIQSDKVRSLMNSIQLLKKENAQLKALGKEHKRSQLIEQLEHEVKDQDVVIDTLRSLVSDDSRCDNAIVKALNAGPPKIKSLTREELKIENKKLNSQILTLKQQLGKGKGMQDSQGSQLSQISRSTKSDKSQVQDEEAKLDTNDTLIKRIEELKNENDELKLNLKAEEDIRSRYEDELERRAEELTELKSAKTDLIVLNKKYEYLQAQLEQMKSLHTGKDMQQMNKDLQMEEMKIINMTQGGKLQAAEKSMKTEVDSLNNRLESALREKEDLQQQYSTILVKYEDLFKRFNDLQTKFLTAKDDNAKAKAEMITKTQYYEEQISQLLSKQNEFDIKIQEKESALVQAKIQNENLESKNEELFNGLMELQVKLQGIKKPDQNDIEINRKIHELIKKQQTTQQDTGEGRAQLQQQKEYYENIIRDMQRKLIQVDKRFAEENISNISSSVSGGIHQSEQDKYNDMNSDVSGNKSQMYGGRVGMMQNEKFNRMNSGIESILNSEEQKVDSQDYRDFDSRVSMEPSMIESEKKILQAPKQTKKHVDISQMNSSISQILSQSQKNANRSELDALSSNVSQAHSQFSRMSSNVSSQKGSNK